MKGFLRLNIFVVVAVIGLAACAPRVQMPGPMAPDDFLTPYIDAGFLVARDGARLGVQEWQAVEPRAVIVALHGMNDYSHASAMPASFWADHGVTTIAIDQRGHGRSPHRGIWPGTDLLVADLGDAVEVARTRYPGLPVYVLGHSMGGAVVINALARNAITADGAILVAPAVWGWSTLPFPLGLSLWVSAHVVPGAHVTGSSLNRWPTDNIDVLRAMADDDLMIVETRIDAVYGVVNLMDQAQNASADLDGAVLVLYGSNDQIIPSRPVARAVERMCPSRRVGIYEGGYHLLLRDLEAERVWQDILTFVEDPTAPLPSGADTLGSERHSCASAPAS